MATSRTVASMVPFSTLCEVLDKIVGTKKGDKRKFWLKRFIDKWREEHSNQHQGEAKTTDSFYPAMRLVLPSFDKDRGAYGFKEHMLATKFIQIFCLNKNSEDAQSLLKYRAPQGKSEDIGDFASKASRVLKLRLAQKCDLSVESLNAHLDNIALANAAKDKSTVERELEMLCRKVTEREMKWLIRMLLKQMKLGMQETTVLGVFHSEAGQLYDVTTSLEKVCLQLHDPATKLDTIQIQLFSPFRPMLANRVPPAKVPDVMGNNPFFVETKYDGERVQLHKDGKTYKYYSRNGNDFTSSYGGAPTEGSLTPYIHNVFSGKVESCILDGEMVGWNPDAQCIATKGEQFDVKSLKVGDDLNPCLVVFDCLMLNGEVLSQKPLRERIELLKTIFCAPVEGRCMLAHHQELSSRNDVIEALNRAIEMREEGLVIKRPDSTYRLNTRSNEGGWLKIKPDYVDAICDDLDLVIVGGYFGEGRRSNLMSHFLLALAEPSEEGVDPVRFQTVCKVGSGYSMKELYDLNVHLNQFARLIRATDKMKVPDWLKTSYEKPEVYIEPKNSKIIQVRAAEIIVSNAYATGYTLRFPRVEKIREDKGWKDCMTTKEFHQLRTDSEGKLAQKLTVEDEGPSPAKKQRKGGTRVTTKAEVGGNFKLADLRGVKRTGKAFVGKELVIVNGSAEKSKDELERGVAQLGGTVVRNSGRGTFCAVAGKTTVAVNNLIRTEYLDIVKAEWLIRCLDQKKLLPWVPRDMWFATKETEQSFAKDFDEYGDSYTQPCTVEELRNVLKNVQPKRPLSPDSLAEFQMEHFPDYKYGMFRRCRFYVDRYLIVDRTDAPINCSPLELIETELKLYGGAISPKLSDCTHVVMHPSDLSRLQQFEMFNRSLDKKVHLVTCQWAKDCFQCEKILDERKYQATM